jgi:hypothetical protein
VARIDLDGNRDEAEGENPGADRHVLSLAELGLVALTSSASTTICRSFSACRLPYLAGANSSPNTFIKDAMKTAPFFWTQVFGFGSPKTYGRTATWKIHHSRAAASG